jgi:pimeloyl-ACP methyl ester carboxylesterase
MDERLALEQPADVKRSAVAAGGRLEPVAHGLRAGDERVDVGQLATGELADLLERGRAVVGACQQNPRLAEREPRLLGHLDHVQSPHRLLRVAATTALALGLGQHAARLSLDQFKYGWANALGDDEAKELYDSYHVAAPGVALMQMANANINPWTEAKLDPANPDRGPLLIIDGEKDHTVPWAIANASYKRQRRNPAVTEITKVPNRGHSLTIDSGWREVADTALKFVQRFT